MTRLLVSVRNAWEASEAIAGGADVVDVKEPVRGSLGAATAETRREVRLAVTKPGLLAGKIPPLSAACGELFDICAAATAELDGYAFAKVGLANCATADGWELRWRTWMASLPAFTAPVAVIYADHRTVAAPSPWEVLDAAIASPARTMLIDTCDKTIGGTLDCLAACELVQIIDTARAEGFLIALAGSISLERLDDVLRFEPDWIAVRGAVCRGGRKSSLDRELVEQFAMRLSTPCSSNATKVVGK